LSIRSSFFDHTGLSTPFFVVGLQGSDKLGQKTPAADVLFMPDTHPTEIGVIPGFAKVFVPLPEFAKAVKLLQP
jgi:hypothetical protein